MIVPRCSPKRRPRSQRPRQESFDSRDLTGKEQGQDYGNGRDQIEEVRSAHGAAFWGPRLLSETLSELHRGPERVQAAADIGPE